MPDEQDPPRKFYQLKPREFERANPVTPGPPPDTSAGAPDPGPGATTSGAPGPIDVRELVRQGAANAPLLSGNVTANRANEVHAMLAENAAHANAAGLNHVALPPKRRSKRKRDYWLLMIAGNGVLLTLVLLNRSNAVVFVSGIAGMGLFTAGFSWVMWQIMSDY